MFNLDFRYNKEFFVRCACGGLIGRPVGSGCTIDRNSCSFLYPNPSYENSFYNLAKYNILMLHPS